LRADADPDANDSLGETALMEAAGMGVVNMCQMLLDARASITQRNEFELTATDFAEDPTVSELLHKVLSASLTTDPPTSVKGTSPRPKLSTTIASSGRNSAIDVVPNEAVRPGRSSPSLSEGARTFEWVVAFEQARSKRKGEYLKSKSFRFAGVPRSLQVIYYPKGDMTAEKGDCTLGIVPGSGIESIVAMFEICLNNVSIMGSIDPSVANGSRLMDVCMPPRSEVTLKVALAGSGRSR